MDVYGINDLFFFQATIKSAEVDLCTLEKVSREWKENLPRVNPCAFFFFLYRGLVCALYKKQNDNQSALMNHVYLQP